MQILEKRAREERRILKKGKTSSGDVAQLQLLEYEQMLLDASWKNPKASNDETAQRQPAEYQKIDLDAVDSSILEAGTYDDKPLIFLVRKCTQNRSLPIRMRCLKY